MFQTCGILSKSYIIIEKTIFFSFLEMFDSLSLNKKELN